MGQEPRGSNAVMTDDASGRERPQTTEPERQTVTDGRTHLTTPLDNSCVTPRFT